MTERPRRLELRTDFTIRTWVDQDGEATVQVIGNKSGRHVEEPVRGHGGLPWLYALTRALLRIGAWPKPADGGAGR